MVGIKNITSMITQTKISVNELKILLAHK